MIAQFQQQSLGNRIASIIEESGLPPHKLELEITETVLMNNLNSAEDTITKLHQMGVTFAIDDFGTGYSSFSLLKDLPVESLKIDRSFLGDSVLNEQEKLIIKAIVSMGKNMSLRVVAEGVETDAQRNFLHSLDCDEFQGYLFSRPTLPETATDLLEYNRDKVSIAG